MNPRSVWVFTLLSAAVVAVDQLVKSAVVRQIGPESVRQERWLFGDWLGLSYAENTGVAFGLMRGRSTLVLALASFVVLAVLALFLSAHRDSMGIWVAGALITGGAIGNVIDRVRFGYVRDFFTVGPWPRFNIADAAITVGIGVAFLATMRDEQKMDRTPIERSPRTENRRVLTDVPE